MALFRSFTFYLAAAGMILTILLVKRLSQSSPEPFHLPPAETPYQKTIAASGIIEAIDKNIEIGVPHSALVKEISVKVGQTVKQGDLLFRLDDRDLAAQMLVLNANVAVSKSRLDRLKDQLQRLESVEDPRAVSAEEINTRHCDVQVAQAECAAAEAQVAQTLLLMDRLNIYAPLNGTILQSTIRKGEFVNSGAQSVMILGDINHLQVRADIDEQNACSIVPHSAATAYPKNNSSLKIPLRFERIEPYIIPKRSLTGGSDERVDTRVLQVIYSFDKHPAFPLYVGQQLDIFIEQPEDKNREALTNET